MTAQVNTTDYQFSHGKTPRGFGSWAFGFTRDADVDAMFWVHQATYGDAKKAAVAEAARRGADTVYVGS